MPRKKKQPAVQAKTSEFLCCTLPELEDRIGHLEEFETELLFDDKAVFDRQKIKPILTSFNNIAYRLCYEDGGDQELKQQIVTAVMEVLKLELKTSRKE